MSDSHASHEWTRTADTCTLPTAEKPVRLAEFDQLFAESLRGLDRPGPTRLRLRLDGADRVEATARDLTARESACCSFFAFSFDRPAPDALTLEVTVPEAYVDVLDGLAERAAIAARYR